MTEPVTTTTPPPGPGPGVTVGFQVVVDCADPHAQARFWAAAIGYELEVNEDFIRGLLGQGFVREEETVTIDGVLYFRAAIGIRAPGASREQATAKGGRLLFLTVPEPKTEKNRLHLDLKVGPDARGSEVERLVGLGAAVLYEHDAPGGRWTTLADPEGNEFCVS